MTRAKRSLVWSGLALARLVEIHDAIARKNPRAADVVARALLARVEPLVAFPQLGRTVPELGGGEFRELIERPYRIVYRLREKSVEVVTVFEAHREFPSDDVKPAANTKSKPRLPR